VSGAIAPAAASRGAGSARWTLPLVLLAALAVRLFALTGDMHFDPVVYAQHAWELLHGTFELRTDSWYAHRLTVFAPVAPLVGLFGLGPLGTRLWPLALSLLQVGLVHELGRRLEGPATGALAALLLALAPLDVIGGTTLQPDAILSGLLCLAATAWILAPESGRRGGRALPLLSGCAFALALVTRENAAPFALLYLATPWLRPGRARQLAWVALGAALVGLPLLVLYRVATGDALYRLRVTSAAYGAGWMQEGAHLGYYPALLLHVRHTLTGAFWPVLVLGLLVGLAAPRGPRRWWLLWAVPLLLYLEFGSMGLTRWLPVLKRERFLEPVDPPLALLAASALLSVSSVLARRILPRAGAAAQARLRAAGLVALFAVLAADSFLIVRDQRREGIATARALETVAAAVRSDPGAPVLFDHWRTGYRVAFALGFREGALYHGGDDHRRMDRDAVPTGSRLGYLRWYPDPARLPDAFVVLEDEALERVRRAAPGAATYAAGEVPDYAWSPPATWRLVARSGSFRVYRTGPAR
jgi:hypothetical protein